MNTDELSGPGPPAVSATSATLIVKEATTAIKTKTISNLVKEVKATLATVAKMPTISTSFNVDLQQQHPQPIITMANNEDIRSVGVGGVIMDVVDSAAIIKHKSIVGPNVPIVVNNLAQEYNKNQQHQHQHTQHLQHLRHPLAIKKITAMGKVAPNNNNNNNNTNNNNNSSNGNSLLKSNCHTMSASNNLMSSNVGSSSSGRCCVSSIGHLNGHSETVDVKPSSTVLSPVSVVPASNHKSTTSPSTYSQSKEDEIDSRFSSNGKDDGNHSFGVLKEKSSVSSSSNLQPVSNSNTSSNGSTAPGSTPSGTITANGIGRRVSSDRLVTGPSCRALRTAVSALYSVDDFVKEKIGSGFFSEVYKVSEKTSRFSYLLLFTCGICLNVFLNIYYL